MAHTHHIRRQRWQFRAASANAAFSLRNGIRRNLDELNAALDRGFQAVDDGEHVIHIPKLMLHLRISHLDELRERLPKVLAEQLGQILLHHQKPDAKSFLRVSKFMQAHQLLLRYLESGNLNWPDLSFDAPSLVEQIKQAAQTWLAADDCNWASVRKAAPDNLEAAVFFFQRLLVLLPALTQNRLMNAALNTLSQAATPDYERYYIIQALYELPILQQTATLTVHEQLYLQAVELACLAVTTPPDTQALLPIVSRELGHAAPTILSRSQSQAKQTRSQPGRSRMPGQETAGEPEIRSAKDAPAPQSLPTARNSSKEKQTESIITDRLRQEQATPDAPPGLRTHAAGLVLLHPYLSRLFDACHIEREADERIHSHHLSRAAALLHWLACGRDEIYEFELGLIKPLLGLRPDDPLPVVAGLLNADDHEECTALLNAVISHWPALRSTSLDGFRISFLQRQGLLLELENSWQLQLESEAFDILLAHLPWGISLIKLPWMIKPIFTDWPTR